MVDGFIGQQTHNGALLSICKGGRSPKAWVPILFIVYQPGIRCQCFVYPFFPCGKRGKQQNSGPFPMGREPPENFMVSLYFFHSSMVEYSKNLSQKCRPLLPFDLVFTILDQIEQGTGEQGVVLGEHLGGDGKILHPFHRGHLLHWIPPGDGRGIGLTELHSR